ncbi:MAG: DNA polymerase I [Rickettsiaceae bacterium]|nr:DNA polymerase I [Rickettsiaceae bacterium]
MTNAEEKKPLLIVDGYGFIFRAYHVQPPLSSPDGTPVGAIYGFLSMLIKLINDFKPEHAVIVLDHSGKNFRHTLYHDYKANRPPAPDDLVVQLKLVESAAKSLNFVCLSKQGFEADDIIATLANKATSMRIPALVVSSDKDLMQLVNEHVGMYDPAKSKFINTEDIITKFGVGPEKVREVQALIGDKSDNIPGVAGIGPKTASQLINQFGSLDGVFSSLDQVKSLRQQELLTTHKENALISWKLVGLDSNVDIKQDIENFHWTPPEAESISIFLNKYGFKSLHKRVENLLGSKIKTSTVKVEAEPEEVRDKANTIEIKKTEQLESLYVKIKLSGQIAVSIQKDGANIKIALSDGQDIYLLPYNLGSEESFDLFSFKDNQDQQISINKTLHDLFEDSSIKKVTYNLKELLRLCECKLRSFEDLQIMDYIVNAESKKTQQGEIVDFLSSYKILNEQLIAAKSLHLYESIDLPISYILHKMERAGVKIDLAHLHKLSADFAEKILELKKKIFAITGEEFNIASPKQLGEILFDKMKLPFSKKTGKSGAYVTNVTILEKLQEEGHEIADLLLKYRHFTKLKNTYTDTLPKQADPRTSRVHTTFLQTVTSTGRLSSTNPNVQNIPNHSEDGSSIRSAFIAKDGCKLISADYSQIELRILSHVANIDSLKQAFAENRDIHAQTASQIFSIPLEEITPSIRYKAKAINFGIIYGISAFGLGRQLNISRKEAADYIEKYFNEYPGIQQYMQETIEFAKENGFVENQLGRRCFLPTINDKNHSLRSFAERAAINAPMQSLASDIVKMAMIYLDKEIAKRSLKTKMILQIHDELIFEAPESEIDEVSKLVKSTMENIINLNVKIGVEVNYGENWQVIH